VAGGAGHGVLYICLLPCLPFQHILITFCCLVLSPFLTVSVPLPRAGNLPLTSKWYPVKYIMWYDTSTLAIQGFSTHQSSWQVRTQAAHSLGEFSGCTRGDCAFFKLSGLKTCASAVKPFWQSRTWCLPMNLNGLHLLYSSVYSEHDFIHDLLIKKITVNSFLKTPLPLYQLTFYKLTWLILKAWKMRNKAKNIRMKLEVTLSECGNSFLYEIFINFTQKMEKNTEREKYSWQWAFNCL